MSECHVSEELKEKLDNQWLIFFDELANKNNTEADIFLQNYINETALWMGIKYFGESYKFVSQIVQSKLEGNRTDVGFVGFDAYKEFSEHLPEWEQLMDWIVNNYTKVSACIDKFRYEGERTSFTNIFKSADYQIRAINYAIYHYAKETGYLPIDTDNFTLWWRPIHNLIANTEIYQNNFLNVIKAIDKLPIENILTFLRDENLSGFSEYQREEERRKAIICLEDSIMIDLFNSQEKRKRFHGQIGLLLPDDNRVTPIYWETIVSTYEYVVGDRYKRDNSDFDFITAMLTFVGNDYSQDSVKGQKLKYEDGHLMGYKIPARWIHKMIFQFLDEKLSHEMDTVESFFLQCRESWQKDYENLSCTEKKNRFWIKYILDNPDECKKVFNDSDYGRLTKKDGNLWLYLKTNKHERDVLLSNKRKAVIDRLPNWWIDKHDKHDRHDVVKRYMAFPYLKVVFTPNKIWIGIDHNNDLVMPDNLPDKIYGDSWHKAWSVFPEEILNNYYEHEDKGESFESYVDSLSIELQRFCEKFIADLGLNTFASPNSVGNV